MKPGDYPPGFQGLHGPGLPAPARPGDKSIMNRKRIVIAMTASVVIVVLGWVAWWALPSGSAGASVRLHPDDPAVVTQGKAIYMAQCASCHGEQLQGQPDWRQRHPSGRLPAPPHDASGHTWHHTDAQLFDVTKRGPEAVIGGNYKSDMQGYGGVLTDDEIIAVLSFIKSTWPADIRRNHDLINGPRS